MILAVIGLALLLAWGIMEWVTRNRWNAWRRGLEARVAEVKANELVRLSGRARATGRVRVADGDPVTVVGRARREGDEVVIGPEDGAILVFPEAATDVALAQGQVRRILGRLLAVAIAPIAAGIAVA